MCLDIEGGVCKNEAYVHACVEKTLTKDLRQKSHKNFNHTSEKHKVESEKIVVKGTKQKKKGQKNQVQSQIEHENFQM